VYALIKEAEVLVNEAAFVVRASELESLLEKVITKSSNWSSA
jgi:hypothetical protein